MPEKQQQQQQRRGNNNQRQPRNNKQNNDRNDKKEDKRRPFVPWLGEERPSKGPIIDLKEFEGKKLSIVFTGGREIEGVLTGHDQLMNMVLEDVTEHLGQGNTRKLGKLVVRGPLLQTVSPVEGSELIANPF